MAKKSQYILFPSSYQDSLLNGHLTLIYAYFLAICGSPLQQVKPCKNEIDRIIVVKVSVQKHRYSFQVGILISLSGFMLGKVHILYCCE